jgi:hypothetical protein
MRLLQLLRLIVGIAGTEVNDGSGEQRNPVLCSLLLILRRKKFARIGTARGARIGMVLYLL